MGHYYGIDWICRGLIAWGIWSIPKKGSKAYPAMMLANVLSVVIGFMASPTIWGNIVGDVVFFFINLRNMRLGRLTSVITNKGENKILTQTWSAP